MKKSFIIFLTLAVILSFSASIPAAAESYTNVEFYPGQSVYKTSSGERKMKAASFVKEGCLFIPIDSLAEIFGMKASWDKINHKATMIYSRERPSPEDVLRPEIITLSENSNQIIQERKVINPKNGARILWNTDLSKWETVSDDKAPPGDSINIGKAPIVSNDVFFVPLCSGEGVYGQYYEVIFDAPKQAYILRYLPVY